MPRAQNLRSAVAKSREDPNEELFSLADLMLIWQSPVLLISSPEYGMNPETGKFDAPVMSIVENLQTALKYEVSGKDCISTCVDFAGSTSGKFCSSRIRHVSSEKILTGESDWDMDYHAAYKDSDEESWQQHERLTRAIENSFWICYWRGKVSGALFQALCSMSSVKPPESDSVISTTLGDIPAGTGGICFNRIPGQTAETQFRIAIAVSISGGPITQVEKSYIPGILRDVVSDIHRRGFEWGEDAKIAWVHFESVWGFLKSLDGHKELVHDLHENGVFDHSGRPMSFRPNALKRTVPVKSPSLLTKPIEELTIPLQKINPESLLNASFAGDIATVEFLLAKKGDVDTNDSSGTTLLQYAVKSFDSLGSAEIVRLLIERKAKVNTPYSADHETALISAISHGRSVDNVRMILDARADVTVSTSNNLNMLQFAEKRAREGTFYGEAILELIQEAWTKKYERALAQTKSEVEGLKLSELMDRMRADGGTEKAVREALDAENPKAEMIEFLINNALKRFIEAPGDSITHGKGNINRPGVQQNNFHFTGVPRVYDSSEHINPSPFMSTIFDPIPTSSRNQSSGHSARGK